MNNHPSDPSQNEDGPPPTFWLLVVLAIVCLAFVALFSNGCKAVQTDAPRASTAAVGVNLDTLGQSLGQAQHSVAGVRTNLSEVDAKAVRIQEAIRNW